MISMVSKPEMEVPGLLSLSFRAQLSGIFALYGKGWAGTLGSKLKSWFSRILLQMNLLRGSR